MPAASAAMLGSAVATTESATAVAAAVAGGATTAVAASSTTATATVATNAVNQSTPSSSSTAGVAWRLAAPLLPGVAHAGSMVAIGYPFDTVKTRLQLQLHSTLRGCVWDMLSKEGPGAFYRGSVMPLCMLVVKRPVEFAVFEWFNAQFAGSRFAPVIGGALAGVVSAVTGCPFSVIKIQMQATRKDVHASFLQATRAVWQSTGARGFYQGVSASVYKEIPFATVYLGTYGNLRESLPKSSWTPALAGGAASMITWTLLQPLDTLKTVIQASVLSSGERETGYLQRLQDIVRTQGVRGLWAGWAAVALRSIPTSAVAMLAYERTRAFTDGQRSRS